MFAIRSDRAQPNPHLASKVRDLSTEQGLELTMINAAYMTRQWSELARARGFYFHMTSNNPLRPANAPDAWERRTIKLFEQGVEERIELVSSDSGDEYRYMSPLFVDAECLGCHSVQGEKMGDLRGGISVNIDAKRILGRERQSVISAILAHTIVWVAVSAFLFVVLRDQQHRLRSLARERTRHRRDLAQKERDLQEAKERINLLERDDVLTGFLRHGFFDRDLQEALDKARDRRESYGLLVLELDYFAEFNEAYGALEGDIVIRKVAELLKRRIKWPGSLLSRYVGISFAIGIPDVTTRTMNELGVSLCRAVYQMGIKHEPSECAEVVSITVGSVYLPPGDVKTGEELMHQAVHVLNKGKQQGRNRAIVAGI